LMSLCFPDTATTGFYALSLHDALPIWGGSPVLEMLVPLVPLTLGEAVRSRRDLVAYALAEREREAERRVAVERARMAREVHDLVAHTIAAVNVQVAAAAAALDTNPEAARRALVEARSSGRAALGELRATVALLRQHESAPGAAGEGVGPVPGLDRLDQLA